MLLVRTARVEPRTARATRLGGHTHKAQKGRVRRTSLPAWLLGAGLRGASHLPNGRLSRASHGTPVSLSSKVALDGRMNWCDLPGGGLDRCSRPYRRHYRFFTRYVICPYILGQYCTVLSISSSTSRWRYIQSNSVCARLRICGGWTGRPISYSLIYTSITIHFRPMHPIVSSPHRSCTQVRKCVRAVSSIGPFHPQCHHAVTAPVSHHAIHA